MSDQQSVTINVVDIPELFRSNKEAIETTIALISLNTAGLRRIPGLEVPASQWLKLLDHLSQVYIHVTGEAFQDLTSRVEQQIDAWKDAVRVEVQS